MRFQIRYQFNTESRIDEIEAGSPEEAVVKFEHLQHVRPDRGGGTVRVTSVSTMDIGGPFAW